MLLHTLEVKNEKGLAKSQLTEMAQTEVLLVGSSSISEGSV